MISITYKTTDFPYLEITGFPSIELTEGEARTFLIICDIMRGFILNAKDPFENPWPHRLTSKSEMEDICNFLWLPPLNAATPPPPQESKENSDAHLNL